MMGGAVALLVGTTAIAATTSGRVVAMDALTNTMTIQADDGRRFLFTRNDATKIEQAPADPLIPMLVTRVRVDELAVAAPAPASQSVAGTVPVESAGTDGGRPIHTAQVESADYDVASPSPQRLPGTATPLLLTAVLGAGLLASGLVVRLRRHHG